LTVFSKVAKLEDWMSGYNTVVGTSDELVKEMTVIHKRIEQLNKQVRKTHFEMEHAAHSQQVAELEAHRKGAKESVAALDKQYGVTKNEIVAQVGAVLKKREELSTRWMEKMLVCDTRLRDGEP
jgi:predicted  nucleic acid-binding Zn-ribbon protein